MKTSMSAMKNILDSVNRWLEIIEEKIGELKYIAIEII